MKLSWDLSQGSGFYGPDVQTFLKACGYQLSVYVDGIKQSYVRAVDTEAGLCVRLAENAEGNPVHVPGPCTPEHPAGTWALKTATLHGKVRVEIARAD